MFATLKNAWKIDDLRRKILFTIMIILLYRLGAQIPVPYISAAVIESGNAFSGSIFEYLNWFSGDAFGKATLFALSVSPYITAQIVIQLLTVAIPALERMAKDGDEGQKKITSITRYTTVALALITAYGYMTLLDANNWLVDGANWFAKMVIVACYCGGASLIMWLSEKVNQYGIGNGISMILFANIVSGVPALISEIWTMTFTAGGFGGFSWVGLIFSILTIIITFAIIVFIVWFTESERRIPVQYAKRIVGNRQYGGARQYIPLKVNAAGVMPIIFAQAIMFIPMTLAGFRGAESGFLHAFTDINSFWYNAVFFLLIVAFTYFYTAITVRPTQMAEDMKRNNGFIPGVKPGKKTAEYLDAIMSRITLPGSIFLGIVAILPAFARFFGISQNFAQFFGGTSLLIMVGVVLDTLQQVESHLTMHHYDGLMKEGKIKGRTTGQGY